MSQFFDSSAYYRLTNGVTTSTTGTASGLMAGYNTDAPLPVEIDPTASFSSENWQLFYQDPVFFIRNYDWGRDYQLGINTTADSSNPALLPTSPDLSQQWNITQIDGTSGFRLTNLKIGTIQSLGVGISGSGDSTVFDPSLNTAATGSEWIIDINPSAGKVTNAMLAAWPSIEAAPTSATSTSSIASSTGTSSSASSATSAATSGASTISPNSGANSGSQSSSSGLSSGAIAGIAIAAVAAVVIAALVLFFCCRRRRRIAKKDHRSSPDEHQKALMPETDVKGAYGSTTKRDVKVRQKSYEKDGFSRAPVEMPGASTPVLSELPVDDRYR